MSETQPVVEVEKTKEELLKDWLKLDKAEKKAKKEKKATAEKLLPMYTLPEKAKSKSFKEEFEKAEFSVKITAGSLKYSIKGEDVEKYKELRLTLTHDRRPENYSLNTKAYAWLKENDPDVFLKVQALVTADPVPASIKVEKK